MKTSFFRIVLAVLLAAGLLAGCSAAPSARPGGATITIATSFYPVYIMALNVADGIPGVEVVDMTQPTAGCLHDYAATPEDMRKLERASVLIINGAGMESFLDKVIRQFPELKLIESSAGIPLIKGGGDTGDNPHVWVSISNAITQVRNIGGGLAQADPGHAAQYRANAEAYIEKLEALRDRMHAALDGLPNRDILTFHEAFPYFAKEFNLNIIGVIEREPGSEPSARELAQSIEQINAFKVKALFAEPQYPASAAGTIARETGSEVYVLDPAVTGPMDANAYMTIMESNLKVLETALR